MCGLKEVGEEEEWTVYWTDYSVSLERVMDMKRFQVQPPDPRPYRCCSPKVTAPTLLPRPPRLPFCGYTPVQIKEDHGQGLLLQWNSSLESLELLLSEEMSVGCILAQYVLFAWRHA